MDRIFIAPLLAAALVASPAASADDSIPGCDFPVTVAETTFSPIRSRADLDAWLARCPSPLDALTPGARERFLDALRFNERGVMDFPHGELSEALTTQEIGVISRLLGLDMRINGLSQDDAARLRAQSPPPEDSDIERRYDRFQRGLMALEEESEASELGPGVEALFESSFPANGLAHMRRTADPRDLGLLFRAASAAAFYSKSPSLTEAASSIYARLAAHGMATAPRAATMMRLLLSAGRIDDARSLAAAQPGHGLPLLPPVRDDTNGRHDTSIWDLEVAEDTLVRRHVALSPTRIVIRASLGCRFSLNAARAIADDPELGPIFRDHAIWLSGPGELIGYESLREWNREHPTAPMHVAVAWEDWPMFNGWEGTPGFYIFRDGELVETATGWPPEGNRDAILAALRRAGLPTP